MSNKTRGWIGVDLDGTLARYDKFLGLHVIGEPIRLMVDRVKAWLNEGRDVRIMTARVSQSIYRPRAEDVFRTVCAIEDWCELHIGQRLKVTCIKDFEMTELWDDRAVQVVPNLGVRVDEITPGVEAAARALLADVRRRYPGEDLRCPYMIALDNSLA